MKNYAKVGNRKGKPAYRTPARFRANVRFQSFKKNFCLRALHVARRGHKDLAGIVVMLLTSFCASIILAARLVR